MNTPTPAPAPVPVGYTFAHARNTIEGLGFVLSPTARVGHFAVGAPGGTVCYVDSLAEAVEYAVRYAPATVGRARTPPGHTTIDNTDLETLGEGIAAVLRLLIRAAPGAYDDDACPELIAAARRLGIPVRLG